jgi:integrase/recombinase XerD
MKLSFIVTEYINFSRTLGMRFLSEPEILNAFCRTMNDIDITEVTPAPVLAYIAGTGPLTSNWHRKFSVLNRFYRFAISRGFTHSSPMPTIIPKQPMPCAPYIYSKEELRRLLAATAMLNTRCPGLKAYVEPATLRMLLCTLYGTGLRIGEALSLTLSDVDLAAGMLTVRNTKFFKSRLVPIGPQLASLMLLYAESRQRLPMPAGKNSAFFSTHTGTPLKRQQVEKFFQRLRILAGIRRKDGARYQPRIHDLRHTFAVHRLEAWYREGADVQRLLPCLSTYLGHVNIAASQRYLSMTPELLREANNRFERYVALEVCHDQ